MLKKNRALKVLICSVYNFKLTKSHKHDYLPLDSLCNKLCIQNVISIPCQAVEMLRLLNLFFLVFLHSPFNFVFCASLSREKDALIRHTFHLLSLTKIKTKRKRKKCLQKNLNNLS